MDSQNIPTSPAIVDFKKINNEKWAFNILSSIIGVSFILYLIASVSSFLHTIKEPLETIGGTSSVIHGYLSVIAFFIYLSNKNKQENIKAKKTLLWIIIGTVSIRAIVFIYSFYLFATTPW